jgi:ABC-2 type transport system ATP-binding protein
MGYVPENLYLYDYLTPLEILTMGARMHGLGKTGLRKHCMDMLERFGIAHVADKRIRNFSKGMTQRTALAHALACQPQLLILDEPLSGLDPIGRKEVVDILADYRAQGGTIFFSSHILNDVQRLADRFGIIHRGMLRSVSTPAELAGQADDRLVVRTKGEAALPQMIADGAGQWRIEINDADLNSFIAQLPAIGHKLIDVRRGPSLEQAFLRFISDANTHDAPPCSQSIARTL